jgi:alpha-D-xyloside xylohydrolase
MPYLYSLAGAVHFADATLMRGLPMDFPDDPAVRDISDQWMFGPALMPCPVYEYKARSRKVCFPAGCDWYDFYTGKQIRGGQTIDVDAPYERIPLYVRAGSILPTGPQMQWSDEKAADDILLTVYAGANADFLLYEDENTNYNYEKGAFSVIPLHWSEKDRTLTVGNRRGEFPGMLKERSFRVVVVDPASPAPFDPDAEGIWIPYSGTAASVTIP